MDADRGSNPRGEVAGRHADAGAETPSGTGALLSIGELADAAQLSRRAIRYYVQQKLLPSPRGVGRGRHYDRSHLLRLRRIGELQSAGHSLEAIRRILDGREREGADPASAPAPVEVSRRPKARLSAELWTRLQLGGGVELHLDTARHNPDARQLLALRAAVRSALGLDGVDRLDSAGESNGK